LSVARITTTLQGSTTPLPERTGSATRGSAPATHDVRAGAAISIVPMLAVGLVNPPPSLLSLGLSLLGALALLWIIAKGMGDAE